MTICETPRLIIREYTEEDKTQLAAILGSPITMQHWPFSFSEDHVNKWIQSKIEDNRGTGLGRWAVIWKENGKLIGDAGIFHTRVNDKMEYDLGYIIDHQYWKKGIGTEVAQACLKYGFEVKGLNRIIANMSHDHVGSWKVAEKIGLKKELEYINALNRNYRTFLYTLSKEEYLNR